MIARLKFVPIALLSLYSIKASAQSIHFTYDNTGNRTARSYYAPASRAKGSTPLFVVNISLSAFAAIEINRSIRVNLNVFIRIYIYIS